MRAHFPLVRPIAVLPFGHVVLFFAQASDEYDFLNNVQLHNFLCLRRVTGTRKTDILIQSAAQKEYHSSCVAALFLVGVLTGLLNISFRLVSGVSCKALMRKATGVISN